MNKTFISACIFSIALHGTIFLIPGGAGVEAVDKGYVKYTVSVSRPVKEMPAKNEEIINDNATVTDDSPLPVKEDNDAAAEDSVVYTAGNNADDPPLKETESVLTGPDYTSILNILNRKIKDSIVYPRLARRRNIEGTVTVSFTLQTDGSISSIRIAVSSGYSVLDNAASDLLEAISSFEVAPENPINLSVNIVYELDE